MGVRKRSIFHRNCASTHWSLANGPSRYCCRELSRRDMTEVQEFLDKPYSLRLKEFSQSCHNAFADRSRFLYFVCSENIPRFLRLHRSLPVSNSRIFAFDISDLKCSQE